MKIIHVVKTLPRLMNDALAARLSVMPAEVLAGARPPGNNTLDQEHVSGERRYRSLADFDVRDAARRDLQDLASICALPDFRRLMQAACLRLVQFLNQTGLGRDVGLPQPTVHR